MAADKSLALQLSNPGFLSSPTTLSTTMWHGILGEHEVNYTFERGVVLCKSAPFCSRAGDVKLGRTMDVSAGVNSTKAWRKFLWRMMWCRKCFKKGKAYLTVSTVAK